MKTIRIFKNMNMNNVFAVIALVGVSASSASELVESFHNPPDSARPGVYWYFMDGNMDREMMEVDLHSMHEDGLRKALFLEVNIGVPRGPMDFMSEAWQDNFANAAKLADQLGIEIILGTGPGWSGSGGPWVKPEQSMQHLCASSVEINTPGPTQVKLPIPEPLKPSPFSGLSGVLSQLRDEWFADVAVLAFPTPVPTAAPDRLDVKALQKTDPYSIWKQVLRYVPSTAEYPEPDAASVIQPDSIVDLTGKMRPDGSLDWTVPPGNWTVMRFAARSTGQTTRPAPRPGHGFEVDKFDAEAFASHFENFHQKLMDKVGPRRANRGWTALHLDSWEMSSQNWTKSFREAFTKQCGYDPQPFYPAYHGLIVGSRKQTERFLYDMRRVAQELLLSQYVQTIKDTAHQNGFYYTSQGYDMNPAGDLDILSMADIPSCEFWINNKVDTVYSCVEAVSAAHTMGKSIVRAEAFTSGGSVFGVSPGDMKNQSNWAFAMGINEFIFHTFQHQPLGKEGPRPGMTMGPHGIHWHRNQTFWPMVDAYHAYVARCGQVLRQGVSVSDVLYLTPEGAPHIFLAPEGALDANKDKHAYGFDAVSPRILMQRAEVKDGRIAFDKGTSYRLLVLPKVETMTPELLEKITELVKAGASIQGSPPVASPSLIGFPECDARVQHLAETLWGKDSEPVRQVGKGRVFRYEFEVAMIPEEQTNKSKGKRGPSQPTIHPPYQLSSVLLEQDGLPQIFSSDGNLRFHQRSTADRDIFFVANRSAELSNCTGVFRTDGSNPELWDPTTGSVKALPSFSKLENGTVKVPLQFAAYEGFFIVFDRKATAEQGEGDNSASLQPVQTLDAAWQVSFDPTWGGPDQPVPFPTLSDWTTHEDSGIKYYSGIAVYETRFDVDAAKLDSALLLDLGTVEDVARATLNGKALGAVWSAPYSMTIPAGLLKQADNVLKIEVSNTWHNRLVGDQQPEDKDARKLQWESGLLGGKSYSAGRYTFSNRPDARGKLHRSGLLGPVQILTEKSDPL